MLYLQPWSEILGQVSPEDEWAVAVYWGDLQKYLSTIHIDQYTGSLPQPMDAKNHPWHKQWAPQDEYRYDLTQKEEYLKAICQKLRNKYVYETDIHKIYNLILCQTNHQLQEKA